MPKKEFCKYGHPRTLINVYSDGSCRQCRLQKNASGKMLTREKKKARNYQRRKRYHIRCREVLTDSYVAKLCKVSVNDAPQDLIGIKRQSIKLGRILKYGNKN